MVHLQVGDRRLVYTADVTFESRLLDDPDTDFDADVMILDGSYGTRVFSRDQAEAALLATIREMAAQGGSVLLPVPRMGRSQEMLLLFAEHAAEMPPVYVEEGVRDAVETLLKYSTWLRPGAA